MKAKIEVLLKNGVFDPQGKTIMQALHHLEFQNVTEVKVGKIFYVSLDETDPAKAKTELESMADELLANPIIERFTVTPVDE